MTGTGIDGCGDIVGNLWSVVELLRHSGTLLGTCRGCVVGEIIMMRDEGDEKEPNAFLCYFVSFFRVLLCDLCLKCIKLTFAISCLQA